MLLIIISIDFNQELFSFLIYIFTKSTRYIKYIILEKKTKFYLKANF